MSVSTTGISTILLLIFVILSFIDGFYLHLWKYRLHERNESLYEHKTHTIRAILFAPILYLLYAINTAGPLLIAAMVIVSIDFLVEIADVLSERDSRSWQGGLTKWEYLLHVMLTSVRVSSQVLILAAKPSEAWSVTGPLILPESYPTFTSSIALNLIPGTILMAALHITLIVRPLLFQDLKSSLSCCWSKKA
jgi:hypothetical protein